jgi:hypothetical protein
MAGKKYQIAWRAADFAETLCGTNCPTEARERLEWATGQNMPRTLPETDHAAARPLPRKHNSDSLLRKSVTAALVVPTFTKNVKVGQPPSQPHAKHGRGSPPSAEPPKFANDRANRSLILLDEPPSSSDVGLVRNALQLLAAKQFFGPTSIADDQIRAVHRKLGRPTDGLPGGVPVNVLGEAPLNHR